jgi:clan AA aspartic protease
MRRKNMDLGENMGKVIEKVKFRNVFEPDKFVEVEALIDTGATSVVLPKDLVDKLGLKKVGETKVRYANNKVETKPIYRAVIVEILGRSSTFDVICEEEGSQPIVGQVVLEMLDLLVDPKSRKVIPNPASPDIPMLDLI